jgi:hypothetical protein
MAREAPGRIDGWVNYRPVMPAGPRPAVSGHGASLNGGY